MKYRQVVNRTRCADGCRSHRLGDVVVLRGKNGIWQRAKNSSDDRAEWERVLEQMIEDEQVGRLNGVYSLPAVAG